jgi:hypothetical protein
MTTLPSSGTHWIEPAASGVATVARPVLLTETSAGVFEFDALTGTPAEIVEESPDVFRIIPASAFASFVESPAGVFTPTPGTSNATPIVEGPAGTFQLIPGGISNAQLVQTSPGVYEIIPDSARRARAYRLGASNNTVLY